MKTGDWSKPSLAETLAADGCHVFEAENAAEALTFLRRVASWLLDLHLPESAALSLLSALRRLAPHATVILMTAFGRDDIVREALDLATFRVVNKPFDLDDISVQAGTARDDLSCLLCDGELFATLRNNPHTRTAALSRSRDFSGFSAPDYWYAGCPRFTHGQQRTHRSRSQPRPSIHAS